MGSSQSSSITSNNFSSLKKKATNPEVESLITILRRSLELLKQQDKSMDDMKVTTNHDIEANSIRKLLNNGLQPGTGRSKLAEEADIRHAKQWMKEVDLESGEEYVLKIIVLFLNKSTCSLVIPRPCSINCYLYLGIALYGF